MQLIANCQIRNRMIPKYHIDQLLEDCAQQTGITPEEICFSFSHLILQAGRQFELMMQVLIPAGIPDEQAIQINALLPELVAKHLRIQPEKIWVSTTRTLA